MTTNRSFSQIIFNNDVTEYKGPNKKTNVFNSQTMNIGGKHNLSYILSIRMAVVIKSNNFNSKYFNRYRAGKPLHSTIRALTVDSFAL